MGKDEEKKEKSLRTYSGDGATKIGSLFPLFFKSFIPPSRTNILHISHIFDSLIINLLIIINCTHV